MKAAWAGCAIGLRHDDQRVGVERRRGGQGQHRAGLDIEQHGRARASAKGVVRLPLQIGVERQVEVDALAGESPQRVEGAGEGVAASAAAELVVPGRFQPGGAVEQGREVAGDVGRRRLGIDPPGDAVREDRPRQRDPIAVVDRAARDRQRLVDQERIGDHVAGGGIDADAVGDAVAHHHLHAQELDREERHDAEEDHRHPQRRAAQGRDRRRHIGPDGDEERDPAQPENPDPLRVRDRVARRETVAGDEEEEGRGDAAAREALLGW